MKENDSRMTQKLEVSYILRLMNKMGFILFGVLSHHSATDLNIVLLSVFLSSIVDYQTCYGKSKSCSFRPQCLLQLREILCGGIFSE